METHSIYLVHAVTDINPTNSTPIGMSRLIGWFPNFNEAETAIVDDDNEVLAIMTGGLSARCQLNFFYWYVIEEIKSGLFGAVSSRTCYHWNPTIQNYEKVPTPECLNNCPNLELA